GYPDDAVLAGSHIVLDVAAMAAAVGLRHEGVDALAHHLLLAVTELAYGGGVDGGDRPPGVDDSGGVRHRVEKRAQMRFAIHECEPGFLNLTPGTMKGTADPYDHETCDAK